MSFQYIKVVRKYGITIPEEYTNIPEFNEFSNRRMGYELR